MDRENPPGCSVFGVGVCAFFKNSFEKMARLSGLVLLAGFLLCVVADPVSQEILDKIAKLESSQPEGMGVAVFTEGRFVWAWFLDFGFALGF